LVAVGLGALGGLWAHALSLFAALALGAVILRGRLGGDLSEARRVPGVYAYFARHVLAFLGYAVLMNADIIMVKHYFSPTDAGTFARAAMVGRIIVFLPQPVAIAMFSKVVSGGETSYESWRTLLKAVILVSAILAGALMFCSIFTPMVVSVLSGECSPELVTLVRAMIWALCPVSMLFMLLNFEIAQGRFGVTLPLIGCAAGYVVTVGFFHEALGNVAAILGIWGTLALALTAAWLPWKGMLAREP
jgi:O-antigen/teichoic acid export membrane protein